MQELSHYGRRGKKSFWMVMQSLILRNQKKCNIPDFPGGPVVGANAGDMGSISARKVLHAKEQLSPCAITIEALEL